MLSQVQREYIRTNIASYERAHEKLERGHVAWNWCGFLFGPFWLIYRKLYKESYICFAILAAVNIITLLIGLAAMDSMAASGNMSVNVEFGFGSMIMAVVLGLLGNKFYFKRMDEIGSTARSREEFISKGGTDGRALVIAIVLMTVFMTIIMAIFTKSAESAMWNMYMFG